MTGRIFLDTNLWIYLYAKEPPEKYQKVEEIINKNYQELQISTQVLGEIFHVLTRKKFTSKADAITIISDIINCFPIQAIDTLSNTVRLRVVDRTVTGVETRNFASLQGSVVDELGLPSSIDTLSAFYIGFFETIRSKLARA